MSNIQDVIDIIKKLTKYEIRSKKEKNRKYKKRIVIGLNEVLSYLKYTNKTKIIYLSNDFNSDYANNKYKDIEKLSNEKKINITKLNIPKKNLGRILKIRGNARIISLLNDN